MALASKTFRIFVSSTFSDLKEERNALQKHVFPKLRELCMQHGCRFQAIDLRWGVRDEASLDQQTMKICLEEIARCQRVTPRPNFIVLLGDRYGWCPLPHEIPAYEFKRILTNISSDADRELLTNWYKRDDNALPPVYDLQPRIGDYTTWANWQSVENRLRSILIHAIEQMILSEDENSKYLASATEREIIRGALKVKDAKDHVFCFFRTIRDLPQNESSKDFVDLLRVNGVWSPDTQARERLQQLKEVKLRPRLSDNVFDYEAFWKVDHITTTHIYRLCEDVLENLTRVIKAKIAQIKEANLLEREIESHDAFGEDRSRFFIGRASILQAIDDYINGTNLHPLAVYGVSGSGKSALMARAVEQVQNKNTNAEVIFRFIGATPGSSDIRFLLKTLCEQIYDRFNYKQQEQKRLAEVEGGDEEAQRMRVEITEQYKIPEEMKKLPETFRNFLAKVPNGKQLIIFLDSLDQLSNIEHARNLTWLPTDLSINTRLIVSTLPGECFSVLEHKLPKDNLIELMPMPPKEGEKLLSMWLKDSGKTLQQHQKEEVLGKFNQNGLPLYLKLAFAEARHWKSYTKKKELSPDITGIIHDLFTRLSSDANHGDIMVSRSLGYLAASKNGLSEDELINILSKDIEVFDDFKKRAYHEPPEERLPVVVWSRLYFDLESYLTERDADGTSLLSFYHRQLDEVVFKEYLSHEKKGDRHKHLAKYFGEESLYIEMDGKKTPNLRKLSELPYQQTYGNLWDPLYKTLTDFELLEAKCTHVAVTASGESMDAREVYGGVYELIEDFRRAREHFTSKVEVIMKENDEELATQKGEPKSRKGERLVLLSDILARDAYLITHDPSILPSHLHNMIYLGSGEYSSARPLLMRARAALTSHPWLRLTNRPPLGTVHSGLIRVLETGSDLFVSWSPDGNVLATAGAETLHLWDAESGKGIARLEGLSGRPAWSPDGRLLAAIGRNNSVCVLDAIGNQQAVLADHAKNVWSIAWSPDGAVIATGTENGKVHLWDVAGKLQAVLEGHTQLVRSLAWSPDGETLASGGDDTTIWLWHRTGKALIFLTGHTKGVFHLVWAPQGHLLASAGENDPVRIWDANEFVTRAILEENAEDIRVIAWSPDGYLLAAGGRSCVIRLWDNAGKLQSVLDSHNESVESLAWSPDGDLLASGSWDNNVRLWKATGKPWAVLEGHTGIVTALTWSSDGNHLASASADYNVRIWKRPQESVKTTIDGHSQSLEFLIWSPDGSILASGGKDCTVRLWDPSTGEARSILRGHNSWIRKLAWSPDSTLLASAGDSENSARLWHRSGELLAILEGHGENVTELAWSPDSTSLATASADRGIRIWSRSGECQGVLTGHKGLVISLTWSPNGALLISGDSDGFIHSWHTPSVQQLNSLQVHGGRVIELVFSPDGKLLVSASDDDKVMRMWLPSKKEWAVMSHRSQFQSRQAISTERLGVRLAWSPGSVTLASASLGPTICLWNSDGTLQAELKGHEAQVWALDWSPDGNFLASGSVDNTVRVWDSLSGVCLTVAHCLAPILALQFDKDGLTLRAADDGSSTSNRPIPYIFTICNIMARSSFESFGSVSKTK